MEAESVCVWVKGVRCKRHPSQKELGKVIEGRKLWPTAHEKGAARENCRTPPQRERGVSQGRVCKAKRLHARSSGLCGRASWIMARVSAGLQPRPMSPRSACVFLFLGILVWGLIYGNTVFLLLAVTRHTETHISACPNQCLETGLPSF